MRKERAPVTHTLPSGRVPRVTVGQTFGNGTVTPPRSEGPGRGFGGRRATHASHDPESARRRTALRPTALVAQPGASLEVERSRGAHLTDCPRRP